MAILYHIKFEFLKENPLNRNQLFPPNLGPGTPFFEKIYNADGCGNPPLNTVYLKGMFSSSYIFPNEDALNNFCNSITMSESEKLSMEEWKELNKIKITYHTYNLPESTIPAPAIFG